MQQQRAARRLPPLPLPDSPRSRNSPLRSALLVMLLIGFTSAFVGGTAAALNATTTNSGFIATASLPGAGGTFSATDSNGDIATSWSGTSFGNGNEYAVYRSNGATSLVTSGSSCPANAGIGDETSYTAGTAIGNAAASPLSDTTTETMTSTSNGFLCYMLFGAFTSGSVPSTPVWLSHPIASPWNPIANAHLPLLVTAVTFTDKAGACTGSGATLSCTLDSTDTIALTYNQPTTHPAIGGNTDVCINHTTGVIYLGSSFTNPTCGNSGQLGSIAPPAGCGCWSTANLTKDPDYTATYAWNAAFTVLTITVTTNKNTPLTMTNNTSAWTLTPSATANVQSNDVTVANRVGVCTASAACLPSTTTRP